MLVLVDRVQQGPVTLRSGRTDLGQAGRAFEFAARREPFWRLLVGGRHVLDNVRVDLDLTVVQRDRHTVVPVEHVVAEAEFVHVDGWNLDVLLERAADAVKTVLVMFASATDGRSEVHAQLGAAIDAADDARHLDGANAQVALDERTGSLGVLTEAT